MVEEAANPENFVRPKFDYWLFSTTWAPRFCCANAKICSSEGMWGASSFFTHGMWPSFYSAMTTGKTYPTYCKMQRDALTQASSSSSSPPVGVDSEVSRLRGRRLHEWSKHGTCTGLTPAEYFRAEEEVASSSQLVLLQKHLQTLIVAHNQQQQLKTVENSNAESPPPPPPPPVISVRALQSSLGGPERVAIKATKHCALEEITLCYAFASRYKAATGSVGPQVNCPVHVLSSSRNSAVVQGCSSVVLDAASPTPPPGVGKGKGKEKEAGGGQGAGDHCAFVSKALLKELRRT